MLTLNFNQKVIDEKVTAENGFPIKDKVLDKKQQITLFDILSAQSNAVLAGKHDNSLRTIEAWRQDLYKATGVKTRYKLTALFFATHNNLGEIPEDNTFDDVFDTFSKSLKPKEQEVLPLLVQGFNYREIAPMVDLSFRTVETHANSIFDKALKAGICQEGEDQRVKLMVFMNFIKQKEAAKITEVSVEEDLTL
jgi:ATP/maltotriose-dependent transcriptional regulator MalT